MTSADRPASESSPRLVRLHSNDNVAVAIRPLVRGEPIRFNGQEISPRCDIPPGHKIAIQSVVSGASVNKYGQPIGLASTAIQPGDHVHTHNLSDHHVVSDDLSRSCSPRDSYETNAKL